MPESVTLNSEPFRDRLKRVREQLGQSQKGMDPLLGIGKGSWQRYELGQTPGGQVIAALAGLGIDAHWLLTGEGEMLRDQRRPPESAPQAAAEHMVREPSPEYALVPLYDVRAAAGHGAVVEEEQIIDSLAFKRQWIQQELHASPGDLYLIYVDGESMEPTLRPGDVILVDRRSAQAVPRDGIYVLRMDGSLLVKRLQRLPGRQVKVTSDNPAYEPFNLSLETPGEDLAIVGRVVWTGRRM